MRIFGIFGYWRLCAELMHELGSLFIGCRDDRVLEDYYWGF